MKYCKIINGVFFRNCFAIIWYVEGDACLIERIKATYINNWCQIIIKRVADSVANATLLLPV